jgi:hypothetical protein
MTSKYLELNQAALDNPQPGDYWQEMFCPYFIVVQVLDQDRFVVLSAMQRPGEPCAKVNNSDNTWSFDPSMGFEVDRQWIRDRVTYQIIDGFVADVVRSEKTLELAKEYTRYQARQLMKQLQALGPEATKYLLEENYD